MKMVIQIVFLFGVGFQASALATNVPTVSAEEAQKVVKALQAPTNPVGLMLSTLMKGAQRFQFKVETAQTQVSQLAPGRYSALLLLSREDQEEQIQIHVEEIALRQDQAYVFSFRVERIVQAQRFPGVSLGNR